MAITVANIAIVEKPPLLTPMSAPISELLNLVAILLGFLPRLARE